MTSLTLPPVLDLAAASPLRATLLASRGQDLELDASAVTRIGGQCVQVLLAAQRTWRADGKRFVLRNQSDPCRETLALMQADKLLGVEDV
ncbi:MAG TPA: STAS domain-containing protein [Acetobacteraceae bacterium]|jgi:chemotaxis protein CheX|nr:STAS domain-containing protein [Acetobacteraceae bacterium]